MKRISLKTLNELAVTKPTEWHQLLAAGTLEPSKMFLNIDEAIEQKILGGQSLPPAHRENQLRSPAETGEIEAICAACQWNINWICEHLGCRPCKQRKSGGLKPRLIDPGFHCPAGKWH